MIMPKSKEKEKLICPKCGIDLPSTYRFYSEEARHEIHENSKQIDMFKAVF